MSQTEPTAQTIVIRARHGWTGVGLRELLGYHELLYFLVWRDVKVRYKQSVIGVVWVVIQPLLFMLILSVFLGQIAGIHPEAVPYPLFVMAGLIPWTFFSQSLIASANSLVESANLLTKVYVPRLIFPIGATGSRILDFGIGMVLLAIFAVAFGFPPAASWLLLLPLSILALACALAVGIWLAALNVRYRDFRHVIPFLVQAWFFATPVAYSIEAVPESLRWVIALNPMTGVIGGFRWATTGVGEPPGALVAASALVTVMVLGAGLAYFQRVQRSFADVI